MEALCTVTFMAWQCSPFEFLFPTIGGVKLLCVVFLCATFLCATRPLCVRFPNDNQTTCHSPGLRDGRERPVQPGWTHRRWPQRELPWVCRYSLPRQCSCASGRAGSGATRSRLCVETQCPEYQARYRS